MQRQGIIAGGNWIVDNLKSIDCFPAENTLANIRQQACGNGGSPYNVLKDIAKLGAKYPLEGVGLIGEDDLGRWILDDCAKHGISTTQLHPDRRWPTSYTDVMSVAATATRTFFHQRGANAALAPQHFDFSRTQAKFFHLGYLLLLDQLDAAGRDGRPRACAVLHAASARGLLTSIDVVSEASNRFSKIVPQVLPEVDYLFINDYETEKSTGVALRRKGKIKRAAVERAAARLVSFGVRQSVFIHFPEAAFALSAGGEATWQASLDFPARKIKGTAGAGDAFAAGVLHGLHETWTVQKALLLGVCCAAASLTAVDCSSGVRSARRCLSLAEKFGVRRLPS